MKRATRYRIETLHKAKAFNAEVIADIRRELEARGDKPGLIYLAELEARINQRLDEIIAEMKGGKRADPGA